MKRLRTVWGNRRLWLGMVGLALVVAVALPATAMASTWPNELAMRESTNSVLRETFVYDPGVGNEISREAFVQAPLAGY